MGTRMKKMIIVFLLFLLVMFGINIILTLIATYLPVKFEVPEGVVEVPRYYSFVFGKFQFVLSQTVVNTWVIMLLIGIILRIGTKNLSVNNPSKLQIILEEYYHFIENMFLGTFGKYKRKFIPFFSALFAFILFLNLSSFIFPFVVVISKGLHGYEVKPFFRTPTADPNTAIGLSLVVVVLFVSIGINRNGLLGYLKTLTHPAWFMLPINIVGELSKPLNTSMRLFGNMFAGLIIGGLLYSTKRSDIIGFLTHNMLNGTFSFSIIWPTMLQLYLDGFVGIIQAFVFTVLSSVYVSEVLDVESTEE